MKITVRTQDGSWLQEVRVGCRVDDHRHYATRVGTTVRFNCETRGVLETWHDVPLGGGNILTEVEVPVTAKCRACGKKLEAKGRGTVHASSGKRSCY